MRIEESEDSADKLSETESMANSDSEQEDEAEDELKQPEKPDTSEIRSQVMETYKNSFRQPGEPEIEISMSTTVNPDVTAYNNKYKNSLLPIDYRARIGICYNFISLFLGRNKGGLQ